MTRGSKGGVNFGSNYCEPLMNGSLNRKILHFGSAESNTISVKTESGFQFIKITVCFRLMECISSICDVIISQKTYNGE